MEIGKYISLGQGIQVRRTKGDTYTYYHNYRDKQTKKVKRVKLFSKDKYLKKDFKEAINKIDVIKDINEIKAVNEKEFTRNGSFGYVDEKIITLNYLAYKYFDMRKSKLISKLRQDYNYLSEEEFLKDRNVKEKLYNLEKEQKRYDKHIKKTKIATMDVLQLQKFYINKLIDIELPKKGLSQKSVSHIISLIKTILNKAVEQEIIDKNPFHYVKTKNPKRKRLKYLNPEDLKLLLDTCKDYKRNFNVYLSVYLGVLTAGRVRTVLNIRKKDIDIKNQRIKLINFKSDKYYTLKLNDEAIEWLNDKVLQHIGMNDYLLRSSLNSQKNKDLKTEPRPMSDIPYKVYKIMDELFNQHLNKSNNYDRDYVVNFHTLRRSVATNLALQGSNIYDIMTLLNHSSTKQTQDYLNLENNTLSTETDKFLSSVFN